MGQQRPHAPQQTASLFDHPSGSEHISRLHNARSIGSLKCTELMSEDVAVWTEKGDKEGEYGKWNVSTICVLMFACGVEALTQYPE